MVGAPEFSATVAGTSRVVVELHRATAEGDLDTVVRLLGLGADANAVDEAGVTALQKASTEGHVEIVKQLINAGSDVGYCDPKHGNSALHESSWKGLSQTVEVLVKAKADVHLKNMGGFAPLHLACQNGHNQTCRILLLSGCKPDIKNNYGDTPLHTAARYGHAGVTRIVLSAHANVKEINKNGDTALHIAAAMGRRKLTRMLLEAGVDQTVKNKQLETPLDIATRKDFAQIAEILRNPPRVLSQEERLKKEQKEQRQRRLLETEREATDGARKRKDKRKEKMNDSGTSSRGSGSKSKEKKKLKGEGKIDPKVRAGRITSWGVDWSPYGCHVEPPTIQRPIVSPKTKGEPPQPLSNDEQYFIDLAGNIKKGPVGVGTPCFCAPLFQTVQKKMERDKIDLMDHIDAAHGKLGARINSLECQTKGHINMISENVEKKIDQEKNDCRHRTKLLKENQENILASQMAQMQNWVEKRLAFHHPSSSPPSVKGRGFLGRRTSFRTRDILKRSSGLPLVRTRSEEAISEFGKEENFLRSQPLCKGLRVMNYPSSMYNIPQKMSECLENLNPMDQTRSSFKSSENGGGSSLYATTNGKHLHMGSLFKVSEPEGSSVNEYCPQTSSLGNPLSSPDLTPLSKSRTRIPLPPNFSCSADFPQDVYVSPELNLAVGNLHVKELDITDIEPLQNEQCAKCPEPSIDLSETNYVIHNQHMSNTYQNGHRLLQNGQSVSSEIDTFNSKSNAEVGNEVRQKCGGTSLTSPLKENIQSYPMCISRQFVDPESSTYLDMDRYRIQAAVRRLYSGYQNEGHVDLSRCSKGIPESSSTEHDSHNDSGYSTKLCSTSQGPSPALSSVPTPLGHADVNEKVHPETGSTSTINGQGVSNCNPFVPCVRTEPEFFGKYRVNGVHPGVQRKIEGYIERPIYGVPPMHNGIVPQGIAPVVNGQKFTGLTFGRSSLV